MSSHGEAWFGALGEPLVEAERVEIAAYLGGIGFAVPVDVVTSWGEAYTLRRPLAAWRI